MSCCMLIEDGPDIQQKVEEVIRLVDPNAIYENYLQSTGNKFLDC